MTRYRKHVAYDVSEGEALDENGVLRDGFSVSVPMAARDAAALLRRPATRSTRLHDGQGRTPGHRPGFLVLDGVDDARAKAYDQYQRDLTSAWRRGSVSDAQARDPRGREAGDDEREREADLESRDVLPLRDGVTLDEARRVHRQRMAREYLAYDHRIAQQWRNR